MRNKKDIQDSLERHILDTLISGIPALTVKRRTSIELVTQVLDAFNAYLIGLQINQEKADDFYFRKEQVFFRRLAVIDPELCGIASSYKLRFRLFPLIHDVLDKAGIPYGVEETKGFYESVVDFFAIYSVLEKIESSSEANEAYKDYDFSILKSYEARVEEEHKAKAEQSLKKHLEAVFNVANLDFNELQLIRAQDRFLYLFREYLQSSPEEREKVYTIAEEGIILSLLIPVSKEKGISRGHGG